jgi:tRNA-(ms[2]io[6]A)-hydroxylase
VSRIQVTPSSEAWVAAAVADLETLLVDHAHCEKRAASTAVRFLFKYSDWTSLVLPVSRLAREELVHFEQVVRELKGRGWRLRSLASASYAAELLKVVRPAREKASGLPHSEATVDEMLVSALIEARSHERFVRLIDAVRGIDAPLADFYASLAEAEARHGELYLELAEEAAGGSVEARLVELTAYEAEVIARPGLPLRMHAGPA